MSIFSKMLAVSSVDKMQPYDWYRWIGMCLGIPLSTYKLVSECKYLSIQPLQVEGHDMLVETSFYFVAKKIIFSKENEVSTNISCPST